MRLEAQMHHGKPGALRDVVSGDYCIGCGACSVLEPAIKIGFDEHRKYVAFLPDQPIDEQAISRVCPFAADSASEDELAAAFLDGEMTPDSHLGPHLATHAGWALESDFRTRGSSGGLVSWLLAKLLDSSAVDSVVHVLPDRQPGTEALFSYGLSVTTEQVRIGAKSRYYPVEMSGVLKEVLARPGKYVVVGIPCFIKAVRLLQRNNPVLRDRIKFTVGIVCGHLKSAAYADMFALSCGVPPKSMATLDFRAKIPGVPANKYSVEIEFSRDGAPQRVTKTVANMFGTNWGHGFFKYKACDFCDDVLGETADVSFGDAWLPDFETDHRGTNVVIVRNRFIQELLILGRQAGAVHLEDLSRSDVIRSQDAGFRHRRDGLAYRLHLADQAGVWRPRKRIEPGHLHLSGKQRRQFAARMELSRMSHVAFARAIAAGDMQLFQRTMAPLVESYEQIRMSWKKRVRRATRRILLGWTQLVMRWVGRMLGRVAGK